MVYVWEPEEGHDWWPLTTLPLCVGSHALHPCIMSSSVAALWAAQAFSGNASLPKAWIAVFSWQYVSSHILRTYIDTQRPDECFIYVPETITIHSWIRSHLEMQAYITITIQHEHDKVQPWGCVDVYSAHGFSLCLSRLQDTQTWEISD